MFRNRLALIVTLAYFCLSLPMTVAAQNVADVSENGIGFGASQKTTWRVGVVVTASNGPMKSVIATVPVPVEWPEQDIKVVQEDTSRGVKISHVDLGGVRQMLVKMSGVRNGQSSKAVFTLDITRREITAPSDTSQFSIPKKVPRDVKRWLNNSPYINARDSKIRRMARDLAKEKESEGAWQQVEGIYDLVREKVEYKEGKIKSATQALKDGYGDCEELTSLFIAMCRAIKVPARMVWVPDHCYPEFYLTDQEGKGHWIPCQAAGTRAFGSMPEMRPILQKGDNFKVVGKDKPQRYVAEYVSAKPVRGSGAPKVSFVREFVQPGG